VCAYLRLRCLRLRRLSLYPSARLRRLRRLRHLRRLRRLSLYPSAPSAPSALGLGFGARGSGEEKISERETLVDRIAYTAGGID
jgi:hypothetical protein